MTVFKPSDCTSWRYDFWWRGQRHSGSTGLLTKAEAQEFETELRKKLRRRAAGLEPAGPEDTPRFSMWAAVTLKYAKQRKRLKRPEQFATNLRMVLGFFGAKPKAPIEGLAPYHDLRLGDVIADPEWIERFEAWMETRGLSGARKNHYRSACSVMYKTALLPQFRKRTAITSNPFEHVPRDRVRKRITTFESPEKLRAVIAAAPWHTRIALAIGALAPKLRLGNVLALRWSEHLSKDRTLITDPDHKTDAATGLPLVAHVSGELRRVLDQAWAGRRGPYVVHYHGRRVRDIKTGLKRAVKAAGLVWGRERGVTYHTLRHTMATELVRMGVTGATLDRSMGWSDSQTSRIYTHLVPSDEIAPLEALGARYQMADLLAPAAVGETTKRKKTPRGNSRKRRKRRMRRRGA